LPPVKGNCLWHGKPQNGSDDWYGFASYQLFDTCTKLYKNEHLNYSDEAAVRYDKYLNLLRDGQNTLEDWLLIKGLSSHHAMSADDWIDFEGG